MNEWIDRLSVRMFPWGSSVLSFLQTLFLAPVSGSLSKKEDKRRIGKESGPLLADDGTREMSMLEHSKKQLKASDFTSLLIIILDARSNY